MTNIHPSSFRDPAGFVYQSDGKIYRQINQSYKTDFDHFCESGLCDELIENHLLIAHRDTEIPDIQSRNAYKILSVDSIDYISYPYEWCFSQYKDAALLTLALQKRALEHGMILKDASAYNVQFHAGRPIFIDTLSFARYEEGSPWIAYRQFCQHFLAPLALMALTDIRLGRLMSQFIDGIPLDLVGKLLPSSSRLNLGLLTHLHLHAAAQSRSAAPKSRQKSNSKRVSKLGLLGLVENLEGTIRKLRWNPKKTDWASYYQCTNYSDASFEHKKRTVESLLSRVTAVRVLDLGANTGIFSRLANPVNGHRLVVSMDFDAGAVEENYLRTKKAGETHILPLVMDLTNPSPSIGWHNHERESIWERASFDLTMALALVHHLAISNNLPLNMIASTLASLSRYLVIEFVPKEDSQVQRLLSTREDIFPDYTLEGFRAAFSEDFSVMQEIPLQGTHRTLFLLEKR